MNVTIRTSKQVRANQIGDWVYSDKSIRAFVKAGELDQPSAFAVGIHEAVEAFLCRAHGITDEQVCEFDTMYEDERERGLHGEYDEPGDDERAPYRAEHQAATHVEKAVCQALGIDWDTHCK